MKDVLVHVTPRSDGALEHGARYALGLAASQGAQLTALVCGIEPRPAGPNLAPDNMQGAMAPPRPPAEADGTARTAALLSEAAHAAGVPCDVVIDTGTFASAGAALASHALVRDLVIVSVRGPLHHPRQALVEAVLFGTGRPIVLVPPAVTSFSIGEVVVAWDATRSAVRALHDAMPLLAAARGVTVVTVTDNKVPGPEQSGDQVCRYLARRAIKARFESIRQGADDDVGTVLLQTAARAKADLMVMGGFAHPREREFLFGSATRSVFQSILAIPVLLSH